MKSTVTTPLAVLLAAILLFTYACSRDNAGKNKNEISKDSSKGETSILEGTLSSTTTDAGGKESTGTGEGTISPDPTKAADVVLRLEGDPKTYFSGICMEAGDESVLNGKVPKKFSYGLSGGKLSCSIQKQDKAKGSLKIILIANGATRSVQQTNTPGSIIKISYQDNS